MSNDILKKLISNLVDGSYFLSRIINRLHQYMQETLDQTTCIIENKNDATIHFDCVNFYVLPSLLWRYAKIVFKLLLIVIYIIIILLSAYFYNNLRNTVFLQSRYCPTQSKPQKTARSHFMYIVQLTEALKLAFGICQTTVARNVHCPSTWMITIGKRFRMATIVTTFQREGK